MATGVSARGVRGDVSGASARSRSAAARALDRMEKVRSAAHAAHDFGLGTLVRRSKTNQATTCASVVMQNSQRSVAWVLTDVVARGVRGDVSGASARNRSAAARALDRTALAPSAAHAARGIERGTLDHHL